MSIEWKLVDICPKTGNRMLKSAWNNFWREWIELPGYPDIDDYLAAKYPHITARIAPYNNLLGSDTIECLIFETEEQLVWFLLEYS